MTDWRERQLEEIRKRNNGQMTATEVMIALGGWAVNPELLEGHTQRTFVPILCTPWGRVMP